MVAIHTEYKKKTDTLRTYKELYVFLCVYSSYILKNMHVEFKTLYSQSVSAHIQLAIHGELLYFSQRTCGEKCVETKKIQFVCTAVCLHNSLVEF